MKKLIEAMEKDANLAKTVFGDDFEAAYKAANAVIPCDRKEFMTFRNEQLAKGHALNRVAEAVAEDPELAKVIFGEDREAAYKAALSVAAGFTREEFEIAMKAVRESMDDDALTDGYEPPDVELTEEDLDRVHGEGFFFVPAFFAANANLVANANAALNANLVSNANANSNANLQINANAVTNANANHVVNANVNWNANLNTTTNGNDWKKK